MSLTKVNYIDNSTIITAKNLNDIQDNIIELQDNLENIKIKPKAGFIYPLASSVVPEGFLLCDGAAYARDEYPELFAAIGTMYGSGDESTTFNVPNLQTRVPVGAGENYELGSTGGEETHTLTINEMPTHTHKGVYGNHDASHEIGYISGTGAVTSTSAGLINVTGASTARFSLYVGNSGNYEPHNNMQPYTVVNYIIATGKDTGVSVQDIIAGAQALPLGIEYGGTGATSAEMARRNLEITPDNIGAMSIELLWENASPTSEFAAQNITLDLSEYNTLKILYSDACIHEILIDGRNYIPCLPLNANAYRQISATSEHVQFWDCEWISTYGTWARGVDNTLMRPLKIYGIKGVL